MAGGIQMFISLCIVAVILAVFGHEVWTAWTVLVFVCTYISAYAWYAPALTTTPSMWLHFSCMGLGSVYKPAVWVALESRAFCFINEGAGHVD